MAYVILPNAEATNQKTLHYNIIIVSLSESCIRINEQGPNHSCPKLNSLVSFDTSNQLISGKFDHSGNAWVRLPPEVKNHYLFYQYLNKTVVCVDCYYPGKLTDAFQTITIEPNGFVWVNPLEQKNNGQILTHHDRYVSENCKTASISFTPFILNDTISYMQSGCKITHYNNNNTSTLKDTPFEMKNPFSSLIYKHMINDFKKQRLGDCIHHKCLELPNLYKKPNWN